MGVVAVFCVVLACCLLLVSNTRWWMWRQIPHHRRRSVASALRRLVVCGCVSVRRDAGVPSFSSWSQHHRGTSRCLWRWHGSPTSTAYPWRHVCACVVASQGLAAFGPQGAVLGPLLVTVAVATYTFLRKALHDSQAAAETLLGQLSPQPQPRTSARRRVVWGAPIRGIETPKGGVATTPAHTAQVATADAAGLGARKPARAPASAPPARRRAVAAGRARCIGDSPAGADAGSGLLAAVQAQCRNGGSRSAHSSIPEGAEECAEGGISPMERTAPASPARARAQATTVGEESSCGVGGDGQGATEAVASPQRRLCAANATALQRSPRRRAVLDA